MKRSVWVAIGMVVVGVAVFAAVRSQDDPIPVSLLRTDSTPQNETPGMCPWRDPKADMQTFFPSSTRYEQRMLIFSDLRVEIMKALGPKTPIDANGIYNYPVYNSKGRVGTIIPQRFPGEYGVVEYVAAFNPSGKIVGLKVQRLREPDATAKAIESKSWLAAFDGRDMQSGFVLGTDIPQVPPSASTTAQAFVDSVRRLTIEYDIALAHGR